MEFISQPWPWYVAGPLIALVLFLMLIFGRNFGVSSNLRTACSMAGAGKFSDFFQIDVKDQVWNLTFVLGAIIGGFIAANYLTSSEEVMLNPSTIENLHSIGITSAANQYLPLEIFGSEALKSEKGILILVGGGFLIGFGARYAGGCTSGHAISGISNLQIPSIIAVVGFFIGGLVMTHLLIPIIF
ncbi:MAG: YeeE/YedE family protein [Bacteroidia bacterium]|nr:YeeE/YedE family protein [Bacteroidia bacterium]